MADREGSRRFLMGAAHGVGRVSSADRWEYQGWPTERAHVASDRSSSRCRTGELCRPMGDQGWPTERAHVASDGSSSRCRVGGPYQPTAEWKPGRESSRCVRWETNTRWTEKRKHGCSTGRVLAASAGRPTLAGWRKKTQVDDPEGFNQ
ncbi:hypothetical protein PO909_020979 [Leuciscus waleckii]